jgi:hypothetical protein
MNSPLKIEIVNSEKLDESIPACSVDGNARSNSYKITSEQSSDPVRDGIDIALRISGAVPLQFTFTDHNTSEQKEYWGTNATELFSKKVEGMERKFFLDTNVLMNCVFSSLELANSLVIPYALFEIPRLSILEMERMANKEKKDNKITDENLLAGLKKRKAMIGFSELLYLRNKGVSQMPELPLETLTAFNNISGNEVSDAWIRKEIKLRMPALGPYSIFPIFITGDLVNSMAAVAEGIDSVYISKKLGEDPKNLNAEQLARFIEYLGTMFQTISINDNTKKIIIKGFWSGISISDLNTHTVLIDS